MSDLTKTMQVMVTFTDRKCCPDDAAQEKTIGPFNQGVVTEADENGRLVLVSVASSKPIAVMDEDGDWQVPMANGSSFAWYSRAFIQGAS